jgi:4-hydroxy-2-oxovalerate aldolase
MTEILDCTLRDGSYVINFKFSKNDTKNILSNLSVAGIKYIEIGHGLGLGASKRTIYKSKASDKDLMKIAEKLNLNTNWGMFCIPGIAEIDDIKELSNHGGKFIRIGSNIEDYKKQTRFIEQSKKCNLLVCSNLMKSYCITPKKFGMYAKHFQNIGADIIYLVDSAGGMFPEEIEKYFVEIKNQAPNIKIGFHGHNNLGLANINALKAYQLGFDFIDCSLQGMGRGAGNTVLEQFLCALARKSISLEIDIPKLMNISEGIIKKKLKKIKFNSIDTVSGMSLFHSSYMPIISKYSKKFKIDPKDLIIAVSRISKSTVKERTAEIEAKKISKVQKKKSQWKPFYDDYYGEEQSYKNFKKWTP